MAALPYMQLYVADYLADTMHLTTEDHGAYLLLIMNYWQTGKPIPVSRLQAIAKLSNARWTAVERTLNEYFTELDGEWCHDRIEAELEKVRAKSAQASRAGKASAAARSTGQEKRASRTDVGTDVASPLNHTDTDTDADTDADTDTEHGKNTALFTKFWEIYPGPRKKDKPKSKTLFNKQSKATQELIINHIRHRSVNDPEWTKGNGEFIPGPVPFLNQNGWTDEYRVNELSQFDEKTQSSIRAGKNFLAEHPE